MSDLSNQANEDPHLESAWTRWLLGDWDGLGKIDCNALDHHQERARLAILAAAGNLQSDMGDKARGGIKIATDWGCDKALTVKLLISGLYNALGRLALLANQEERALQYFANALTLILQNVDVNFLTRARRDEQARQLGISLRVDPGVTEAKKRFTRVIRELRSQNESLRRQNCFLDFLTKLRGADAMNKLLAEAASSLVSKAIKPPSQPRRTVSPKWVLRDPDSWLCRNMGTHSIEISTQPLDGLIGYVAALTNQLGPLPLWTGYGAAFARLIVNENRTPKQVGIPSVLGSWFTHLTKLRRPRLIVEIGTAFGVSGMYWLAGLEENNKGTLVTFEANALWQRIAVKNLDLVSSRYKSISGPFEQNVQTTLEGREAVDILFVDAVHTDKAVTSQLALIKPYLSMGALIVLDDINSSAEMYRCWRGLSAEYGASASLEINGRLGVIEYQYLGGALKANRPNAN